MTWNDPKPAQFNYFIKKNSSLNIYLKKKKNYEGFNKSVENILKNELKTKKKKCQCIFELVDHILFLKSYKL